LGGLGSHESLDVGREIGRAGGQTHAVDAGLPKQMANCLAVLAVPIHEQVLLVTRKPDHWIREIPGHLLHPSFVRTGCAASQVNTDVSDGGLAAETAASGIREACQSAADGHSAVAHSVMWDRQFCFG
jgi:hypothetical protein